MKNGGRAEGPIHWFTVTNSSDSGIGVGSYTTNEMFKLLGKQDVMPNVARAIKQQKLEFELAVCKGYEAVLYNQKMISPTPGRMQGSRGEISSQRTRNQTP
ncbi:hypothetical protein BKG95_06695 [Rodentibacter pneumotropicus]|uniref:hypothetical protein n=1 Tax=Rodentibacter pneumotropicus TaxID=758 RepID=UPI0009D54650|nr:hypothetical protein [Rodentibacter pneumotropicus]OOF67684.1 hypothetical protein BKG95_06695 [Rodentibacter pneumotropicus]